MPVRPRSAKLEPQPAARNRLGEATLRLRSSRSAVVRGPSSRATRRAVRRQLGLLGRCRGYPWMRIGTINQTRVCLPKGCHRPIIDGASLPGGRPMLREHGLPPPRVARPS
jgi:hypothetical protein